MIFRWLAVAGIAQIVASAGHPFRRGGLLDEFGGILGVYSVQGFVEGNQAGAR